MKSDLITVIQNSRSIKEFREILTSGWLDATSKDFAMFCLYFARQLLEKFKNIPSADQLPDNQLSDDLNFFYPRSEDLSILKDMILKREKFLLGDDEERGWIYKGDLSQNIISSIITPLLSNGYCEKNMEGGEIIIIETIFTIFELLRLLCEYYRGSLFERQIGETNHVPVIRKRLLEFYEPLCEERASFLGLLQRRANTQSPISTNWKEESEEVLF